MKFVLEIELGNDAMRSCYHVAKALHDITKRLKDTGDMEGKIRDINGNTVGSFYCDLD